MGWSRGARFYPLLYMLTRVYGARDRGSGLELYQTHPGQSCGAPVAPIFPKRLYELRLVYCRGERPCQSPTFLTTETNLEISDQRACRLPAEVPRPETAWSGAVAGSPRIPISGSSRTTQHSSPSGALSPLPPQQLSGATAGWAVRKSALQDWLRILGRHRGKRGRGGALDTAHRWVVEQRGCRLRGQFVYEVADPQAASPWPCSTSRGQKASRPTG